MVELRDRRLLVDGKPVLVFAGEIHYFRLKREEWEDRILKLKALGCNAVATYIPWIVHEEREGEIDVSAVAAFVDLCHRHGLWFIARPGPFVMAEMKNEGIPYWVYTKFPDAVPVSFRGEKATTKTLDYLHPGYLEAVSRWYGAIMPILAQRLQTKGGPVIGVQLDNEVGMLQWVSNQPDLSDDTLCDFATWLGNRYTKEAFSARYPFDLFDPVARAKGLREPKPEYGPNLLRDYGDYERDRFARYIAKLRSFAESHGVTGVPFLVNVHGSGGGRGVEFPIGIHQLNKAYTQAPGYWAGSDHYLGELTRENAPDLYYLNAFMAAVNRPEQPLSSLEFEVGTGDYGELGMRMSNAAADFKVRLSVAQGNRLINYYLLAGGRNPKLVHPVGDGNDRIAITGERHGFAAPISPEGALDPTYDGLKDTTRAMLAVAEKLADMDEEHDDLALAFVPDYYKTDFHLEGPMQQAVDELRSVRDPLGTLTRSLLMLGYRFPATDIQNRDPDPNKALVFASSAYLDESVQTRLARYVRAGGRLLLFGRLPVYDMEGRTCLALADALGWTPAGFVDEDQRPYVSMKGEGWAETEPEVRTWGRIQTLAEPPHGAFIRIVGTRAVCGAEISVGKGRAIFLGFGYPFHPDFYRSLLGRLDLKPGVVFEHPWQGVLTTSQANKVDERFVTLINLDSYAKEAPIRPWFPEAVRIEGRSAKLLPVGVRFGSVTVVRSTTELVEVGQNQLRFKRTGTPESIRLDSKERLEVKGAEVEHEGGATVLHQRLGEEVEVRW